MIVRFKEACEIEVTDYYDEENDEPITHMEAFAEGEEVEFDVVDEHGGEGELGELVNIQFFDGSVAFGIPTDSFEIISREE